MSPSSEARSHPITRSNSISSSVASGQTTHSFLPVIEHEDLFSASFVLGAVVESPSSPPRAPYLRPISTMASPKLPAASSSTHTATTAAAFSPSLAGMRSTDTLVSVARRPSITSLAMLSQSAASKETLSLPPTLPLVISHQKRSLRSRFSLSRATPAPPPMAEPERTKRAFSLPFNLPSHSTVSLAPSTTSTTSDLTNLLLPEADVREVDDEEAAAEAEDASWIPPPPPAAKGQSEAPVKGKGGPGWYGGKRINERGEVIQVAADGTETVIMRLPQKASSVVQDQATTLPSVLEQDATASRPASRKLSASSFNSHSSDASSTSSLFDSYSEGASSRSSFSSAKSSNDDDHHHKEVEAGGSQTASRTERRHRHRRTKILSALKAQHSAEKLALSSALDESREKVDVLTRDNAKLQEECRELRALVLDIRRVIQGDSLPPPSAPAKVEAPPSLLPPALIRSSRSSTSSSSSEDEAREQQDQQDAKFGGGVGRQWFDEDASSDDEDDEDPTAVRELIAAFPPSPTSIPATAPPTAPLPSSPHFGFRSTKSSAAAKGHKSSASMSSFSRIPMPRTKRSDSAPKLVIGTPQDFRSF